jgi:hypothetical protein
LGEVIVRFAASFLLLGAATALGTGTGNAQYRCTAPAHNEWLTRGGGVAIGKRLPEDRVRSVTQQLDPTIELLNSKSSVLLSDAQVRRFTGKDIPTKSGDWKAFLVRAVFPVANPKLDVLWDGDALEVSAFALGCAQYVKHPVVVFLERAPSQVFVTAGAAL